MSSHRPRFPEFFAPADPCNLPVRRCPVAREAAEKRILVMRTGAHGDILMATPLLAALRDAHPRAHIGYLVDRKERETIDAHPYVDEVIAWDGLFWKRLMRRANLPTWLVHALRFRHLLRERRYDVFISLQGEEWPTLARNVGAATRVGVFDVFRGRGDDGPTSRNTRRYTHAFTRPDLPPHRVRQFLLPLGALGVAPPERPVMEMGFTTQDDRAAAAFLDGAGIGEEAFVALAPLTTWPSRCWPGERFAALGDRLASDGLRTVLVGSLAERDALDGVARRMGSAPVLAAGAFGFRGLAALLSRATLVVSGDTGPMHLAAAVGTPYVALFGPTPPEGRAPLSGRGRVLLKPVPCGPCDRKHCDQTGDDVMRCMRLLSVEEVYDAARETLRGPQRQAVRA